ncbi:hypothetical protein OIDMADRAFT_20048, partial [Oidiodendron maius Zn]
MDLMVEKLTSGPNDTSYDWWYFDAVSASLTNESTVLEFLESGPQGFASLSTADLFVLVSGSFRNGTIFSYAKVATV